MSTKRGRIEQAVWRDLTAQQRRSGLGTAAMALASALDGEFRGQCAVCEQISDLTVEASARDMASVARELRATLLELKKVVPVKPEEDSLAQRRARRAATRAAG